jgi:hypothetical protein
MKVAWERLIRFVTTDRRVLQREPVLPSLGSDLGLVTSEIKPKAKVIEGDRLFDVAKTDQIVMGKLLGRLAPKDV